MAKAKHDPAEETGGDCPARQHVCSTCHQSFDIPVPPDDKHFPFCTRRCQLIDLGKWFDGEHFVSTPFGNEEE